jgi:hypothetical protein
VLVDKELFLVRVHCSEELFAACARAVFETLGRLGAPDRRLL